MRVPNLTEVCFGFSRMFAGERIEGVEGSDENMPMAVDAPGGDADPPERLPLAVLTQSVNVPPTPVSKMAALLKETSNTPRGETLVRGLHESFSAPALKKLRGALGLPVGGSKVRGAAVIVCALDVCTSATLIRRRRSARCRRRR
jgi:hypothetical protein